VNWKQVAGAIALGLIVLAAAVVGGISLYSDHLYRTSYDSHYSYRVSFASNQSLDDVTVYAPVPVEDGKVRVVSANLTAESWDETTPDDAPPVNASIVQTEHGPMLAIQASSFPVKRTYYRFVEENGEGRRVEITESEYEPGNPEMVAYTERSVEVQVEVEADHSIDTRDPTGTEPILAPELQRTSAACDDPMFDTLTCYDTESEVYLSYAVPGETRTSLWVELEGRNEWWIFGWNGNYYTERYIDEFHGPQDGWRAIDGTLETGWGNYRGEPPS